MQISIHRDLSAIRFVRCFAQLPNKSIGAGGAGFTLAAAAARCRSEYSERIFYDDVLRPASILPEGMAAHPKSKDAATRSAYYEALETHYLRSLKTNKSIGAIQLIGLKNFELYIKPLNVGTLAFIRCQYRGIPMLFYTVRGSVISSILKVWEEYRNPYFYDIPKEMVPNYTKAQKLLGADLISKIRFNRSFRSSEAKPLSQYVARHVHFMDHHIVYLIQGEKNEST